MSCDLRLDAHHVQDDVQAKRCVPKSVWEQHRFFRPMNKALTSALHFFRRALHITIVLLLSMVSAYHFVSTSTQHQLEICQRVCHMGQ